MATESAVAESRLDRRLVEALSRRGIDELTEIQRLAIPLLHTNDDALLISPTGTGKTEAALLPLLSRQLKDPSPPISILYLTPLRALNRDLEQRLVSLAEEVGLVASVRHGDTPPAQRLRQSRRPPDLLITTPETLQLFLVGSRLRESVKSVRAVIVDEVHELAPSDRGAQLALTLERLDSWVGRPVRRIGLSATVGNPPEVSRFLSPPPRRVEIRQAIQTREVRIRALLPSTSLPPLDPKLQAELKAEPPLLAALRTVETEVRAHTTTLVFVNTRPTAEGLAARLSRLAPDLPIAVHHGSLSREIREEAEREFREGRLKCLVATSSLELGIDIGSIDLVIQFGSPHQAGRLLQRIGRSGHRLGRVVRGLVLALDEEDLEEAAVLARRAERGEVEPIRFRTANRLAVAQQIIGEVRARRSVSSTDLFALLHHAAPAKDLRPDQWAELIEYLAQLGLVRQEGDLLHSGRATLQRFYASLSLIPDERTYRLRDLASRKLIGTLDERFVLTQILAEPQQIFLLHGRTWRVVEFRGEELLVEAVSELGQEPRWVGEDLPVPFDAAMEIGLLRREGHFTAYPLAPEAASRLVARLTSSPSKDLIPTDQQICVTAQARLVTIGAVFGNRTNETLALVVAGLLTARLGARVEVLAVEPLWFVLELPVALEADKLRDAFRIDPSTLEDLLDRLVPSSLEYRWVFLTVARKLGVLPASADPQQLRFLEPLLEESRKTPLGQEALEKTLHDRFDVEHTREVLERIARNDIRIVLTPPSPWTDLPLDRLKWRAVPDVPPPTLLKAIEQRLKSESLVLVCLRCGFQRTTSAGRYKADGGSRCLLCHGSLSAVLSPRRTEEIEKLVRYAKRKWKGKRAPGKVPPNLVSLVRAAYTSAELLAHYGERALYCLAARGIGPDTARRLLMRLYRDDADLFTEILRAERTYARTRSFWE